MNARDALVMDFEQLIDVLDLPDANDRHVLAPPSKAAPTSLSRSISGTSLRTKTRHIRDHLRSLIRGANGSRVSRLF
jgi:hypothetical protein